MANDGIAAHYLRRFGDVVGSAGAAHGAFAVDEVDAAVDDEQRVVAVDDVLGDRDAISLPPVLGRVHAEAASRARR